MRLASFRHRSLLIPSILLFLLALLLYLPRIAAAQDSPPVQPGFQIITATGPEIDVAPVIPAMVSITPTQDALPAYVYAPKPLVPAPVPSIIFVTEAISVDVSTLDSVQAGEWLTYVYRVVNTGTTSVSGIIVDATWSNLTGSNKWQACNPIDCAPAYVIGPSVVVTNAPSGVNARYLVGTLSAGATAEFGVRLKVEPGEFPETGVAIKRPAGSAKAYANSNLTQLLSQDTANSTIVGPVLVLTKTAIVNPPVYVNEPLEWVIRVGNATGTGDQQSGVYRADARPGTNVLIFDDIAADQEFVSATGSYVTDGSLITWTVPSLAIGSFQEVRVRFRKRDLRDNCFRMRNSNYEATSDEFAIKTGTDRYTVRPGSIQANLLPPINVPTVTVSPGTIYYGDEALITVTVQNNYSMPLPGVVLRYKLRPETEYVLGSANTVPISLPVGAGGDMLWQFDMAAGTRYTPTLQNFTFKVKAGYFDTNTKGYGMLDSSGSITLPIQCATTLESANYNGPRKDLGGPEVKARLLVTHTALTDAQQIEPRVYLVTRGTNVRGVITVTNRSSVAATNTTVLAALPGSPNANLAYVTNTATVNGVAHEPDFVQNGNAGGIAWYGLNIPAYATIYIHYTVQVIDGYDYVILVTTALAMEVTQNDQSVSNNASIPCTPWNLMCLKLQPRIGMSKVSEQPSVGPGQEVTFSLSLVNEEGYTVTMGIVDALWDFDYVRQITGYATPVTTTVYLGRPVNALRWPVQAVGPGQALTARIVARMPGPTCIKSVFTNELLFNYLQPDSVVSLIRRIPPFEVDVACRSVKYKKSAALNVVNLLGVVTFTLSAQNTDVAVPISNVQAVDVLPAGFVFVSMDTSGDIQVAPVQTVRDDGRTALTWTFDLPTDTKYDIKYRARAGSTVSTAENWYVAQANSAVGWCQSPCRVVTETINSVSTPITYSYDSVDVQPLLTLSPEVTPAACALPNDLRLYRLSILNANTQPYVQITATVALPLGVRFSRVVSGTTAPQVSTDGSGVQTLKWTDLAIIAKPANQYAAQLDLWVELKLGQALGSLDIVAQASSFDTIIPRRDGVQDPSILMCSISDATLAKNVSQSRVVSGTIVTYELLLANPTSNPIVANVDDVMPPGAVYIGNLDAYSPAIGGQTLTWSAVVVPAATPTLMGTATRTYQVRVSGMNVTYTTNVTVTNSSVVFNPSTTQSQIYVQTPGATISGTVFVDVNMNGVRDAPDATLGNVSVSLQTSDGGLVVTTTQGGIGSYLFTDVFVGAYTLTVNRPSTLLNTTPAVLTGMIGVGETLNTAFGLAAPPSLSIVPTLSVSEGNTGVTAASLNWTLTRAVSVPVSVRYTTVDTSTAKLGTDFAYASAVVTVPAGSTSANIPISINGDISYEGNEIFYVNLSAPVNGKLGTATSSAVTILNDDTVPIIGIDAASINEGASGVQAMNFTISLSAVSGVTTSVMVSTAVNSASNNDFSPVSLSVDIPPGATSVIVPITVNGDVLYEPDETFFVVLSNPVNGTIGQSSATGMIVNDDALSTLAIGDTTVNEGSSGSRSAVFTLTLSAVAGVPMTVSYATADATATAPGDYAAASGTAVIAAGASSTQITITTNGDLIFEPDETFVVNLSSAINATLSDAQAIGTIKNDDNAPSMPALTISDATVTEGNSATKSMVFTVSLSSATGAVSVTYATLNGTAVAPADFGAVSGVLTFPANTLSRTITVTVNGDTILESDETFTLELSNPFGATLTNTQATGTIKNDDVNGATYKIYLPGLRR